jgi:hypothetical protein
MKENVGRTTDIASLIQPSLRDFSDRQNLTPALKRPGYYRAIPVGLSRNQTFASPTFNRTRGGNSITADGANEIVLIPFRVWNCTI